MLSLSLLIYFIQERLNMDNDINNNESSCAKLELAKEILRQGELRIKGILEFSTEIDNKIFKLLSLNITITLGILFFLLKTHNEQERALVFTCILAIFIFTINVFCLLIAGSPYPYKGAGLPLNVFDQNKTLTEIFNDSKKRYATRFERNMYFNGKKNWWLMLSIYILVSSPIIISLFFFFLSGSYSFLCQSSSSSSP